MIKSYKRVIIALIVILIIYGGYVLLINSGVIRNYHIKDFIIDVNIDKSGDIHVKEDTEYRFNGAYNGITITIPTDVSKEYYEKLTEDSMNDSKELPDSLYICNGIENVNIYVLENDQKRYFHEVGSAVNGDRSVYTVIEENGFTTFKIYEPSVSVDKRIVIEYTLKDVVVQHNDVAELFWNFIGGEVECKIKNLQINVHGENILKSYTHGNASGKLVEGLDSVTATYKNVKPREFVSTRIILNWNLNNIAKQNNVLALPLIEELEESYLSKKQTMIDLIIAAIIMTIVILAYWIFLLFKYEREIEPVSLVMDDIEVLDKYNPMIAACIAQNRGMHPRDIIAVLIDLVNIKALKMVHILGYVVGTEHDMYKLTKNEEFFSDKEKVAKLDDIQNSIISIFFECSNEIELTKRLKVIQKNSILAGRFKTLDSLVSDKLEKIGANYESVPKFLRIFNTFLFIIVCAYVVIMMAYSNTLDYVKLSSTGTDLFAKVFIGIEMVIGVMIILLPIILLFAKIIVKLINDIRVSISRVAYKLTSKKLTRTIIILFIVFAAILAVEIFFLRKSNIIIATILLLSALLVVLTDNLMTAHTKAIRKEYVMLKLLQYKIEEGSLLNEKQIKDNILWNKYFTYAIALGVADVAEYMKYIPDTLSMFETFNSITDSGFGLYDLHRELVIEDRLKRFEQRMNNINSNYINSIGSGGGGGSSGGGFSSGGGRFSGGGGRGGGRGAF